MSDVAVWSLVLAVAVNGIALFFRTPNQTVSELEKKVAALEGTFNALSRDYAGVHGRHDEALRSLTAAVTRLTDRFDQYMGSANGTARIR